MSGIARSDKSACAGERWDTQASATITKSIIAVTLGPPHAEELQDSSARPSVRRKLLGEAEALLQEDAAPDMQDPGVVDALVRQMLLGAVEIRRELVEASDVLEAKGRAQTKVIALQYRWAALLDAANGFDHSVTTEGQHRLILDQGYGSNEDNAVLSLVAATLSRLYGAMEVHEHNAGDDEMLEFLIATAIEDCTAFVMGFTNSVD